MTIENVQGVKVDSIVALISKLKDEEVSIGSFAMVRTWFEEYRENKEDDNYYKLVGFIRGLASVGFISEIEEDLLISNLIYINRYHFDDDGNEFWIDETGKRHYTRDEG